MRRHVWAVSRGQLRSVFSMPDPACLRLLAACQPLVDVVDDVRQLDDAVDDVVGAGGPQDVARALQAPVDVGGGQRQLVGLAVDVHVVAVARDADAPAAGVDCLADAGRRVVHLDGRRDGEHVEQVEVAMDHERSRSGAVLDFVAGDGHVGHEAVRRRLREQHVDHAAEEAGRHADGDTVPTPQLVDGAGGARQQAGVLPQHRQLLRHEVGEHAAHVGVSDVGAVRLAPPRRHGGLSGDGGQVKVLAEAHRLASLLHRYRNLVALENLEQKYDRDDARRNRRTHGPMKSENYIFYFRVKMHRIYIFCAFCKETQQ